VLKVHPEVQNALETGRAVVALESSIIAHGLPIPHNQEVARGLEEAVRASGAVPATIAIFDRQIHIGLEASDFERLNGTGIDKCAASDMAVALSTGRPGATTVSATIWAAARAGIRVVATGGIGGVHRGDSFDESSDLQTLASLPVCVVSAGAKLILDIPKTIERLETHGVLVLGFQTQEFPAFYCRSSGVRIPHRVNDSETVASILYERFDVLRQGGVLLCRPIPETHALPLPEMNKKIEALCAEAAKQGIAGKALTPYLLSRLAAEPGIDVVAANRALALANAGLAGQVASALVGLK
jgi:pseudouridine-5'-phosphate glycosidase